ncbi:MarR family winged helix-turn-helix transcriptional regulator [Erythrobacter ani]|uniref:Winged helix-turn-helix transcriptional regulator n=1 Tax=Erythrobacter ani TaxID=2827235 RepID=A0ABS6SNY2_9SPHN|nr:MarR family winged helix-turn-helix transcriptional regulator [Erythrobacter ani]MBV7266138.1 winged helix-turn-helix transcriptional regulator [Erythrobacter ani]
MSKQLRVFHRLQAAHSALFRAADRHLRDTVGLGNAQQTILFMLMREDGLSLGSIARQLQLGKPGVSGLVDRLEAGGFAERRPDPDDARGVRLHILPAGRAAAQRAAPITKAINRELLAPFSESERDTIARFLDHLAMQAEPIVASKVAALSPERISS